MTNTIVCGQCLPVLGFFPLVRSQNSRFGLALRSLREQAGLSQEDLAHMSGLHRTYVSQLERGLKSPSLNVIWDLARALRLRPHVLIKATEEKKD